MVAYVLVLAVTVSVHPFEYRQGVSLSFKSKSCLGSASTNIASFLSVV